MPQDWIERLISDLVVLTLPATIVSLVSSISMSLVVWIPL